jgi:chromosome segregation ATPase
MPNHFWCRKHSLLQIPDCCTYFRADILEEIVLTELYRELMRRGDLIKQRESLGQFQKEELNELNKELGTYRTQYRNLQVEKDRLYESYAAKQIGAGEYRSKADGIALQMQELSCKIEETELAFSRLTEEYNRPKQDIKEVIRFSQMEKLTQEAVDVFIKKVTIYRDKRVEIEWNYGEYTK